MFINRLAVAKYEKSVVADVATDFFLSKSLSCGLECYFSGSICIPMCVLLPNSLFMAVSIFCVTRCASVSDNSPFNLMCTSMAIWFPMRRVRKWWGELTSGKESIIDRIFSSVWTGRELSNSSSTQGLSSCIETFMIKKLTIIAAKGSNTLQFSPRRIAPPIPTKVPIEESASLRWCQALASRACELRLLFLYMVYW